MFISKKDLDNLESKLRAEFEEKFNGIIKEWNNHLEQTLRNWELKPRQKSKKVVD